MQPIRKRKECNDHLYKKPLKAILFMKLAHQLIAVDFELAQNTRNVRMEFKNHRSENSNREMEIDFSEIAVFFLQFWPCSFQKNEKKVLHLSTKLNLSGRKAPYVSFLRTVHLTERQQKILKNDRNRLLVHNIGRIH